MSVETTAVDAAPALVTPRFIHLRTHSAFSLLEGALPLGKIIGFAKANKAPAIAVADTNNLFGALEFAQKASKEGIQPIIGCQLSVVFGAPAADGDTASFQSQKEARKAGEGLPMVFIAADQQGYENLVELVSQAYLDPANHEHGPRIFADWLESRSAGVIALSGGIGGPLGQAFANDHPQRAVEAATRLKQIFGDRFYIELQRYRGYNTGVEAKLVDLAYALEIPLVATNEAFFLKEDDYDAHDALLAIAEGSVVAVDERRRVTPDHRLKSEAEMVALFADMPEALANTVEIARRCHYFPDTRAPILPLFAEVAPGATDEEALQAESDELKRQARQGLEQRLAVHDLAPGCDRETYAKRLDYELDVIESMKFPGYFLIVADFIKWAKDNHIPVGPGRGSGAGSLVAWSLTITDIDPLRFSLLFERFLNPDRVSMPDFDIDFCQDRREEVIRYVQQRYGREQVAQIITFGTLQARAVLRDVGRVLQMPYGQVDRLCKLVPNNPANPTTLAQAIEGEPKFAEEKKAEAIVGDLLDMSLKLEGLYRHASTHAAGIVIGDRPLSQLVPMYRDPRSDMPVTQFNMKWVEQAGLVKFDFLGLKTLTVLDTAVKLIARRGITIDLSQLPIDDADTYALLSRGETVGVFQVESVGMRKALLGMKPDRIEDIIALVALYRPGPMDNIPVYNARKNGEEKIGSIHPMIDHLVAETQGVIIYQEQVMQIAQELSGYSLGEADLLRRAMGKKIRAEMDKQRVRFVDGAKKNDLTDSQANAIFDLLAKFADYGFNKSHAAAYAMVSYQTAYLKAHYPVEFLAASMSYDMAIAEKLNDFRRDAMRLGITVHQPSVQTSYRTFEVAENTIFYALAAIKGVGEAAVDHIVERRADTPFANLEDFARRIDPRIVNKRAMEQLICAGALDCFGHDRASLVEGLERIVGLSQRIASEAESGQGDIFGASEAVEPEQLHLPTNMKWPTSERLLREFQAIGFYFTAHPLDTFGPYLEKMRVQHYSDFSRAIKLGATAGRLAGTVASKQIRRTKSGNKMCIAVFSDTTGQFEVLLFSEMLERYGDMLEVGTSFIMTVAADDNEGNERLRLNSLTRLDGSQEDRISLMRIFVRDNAPVRSIASQLPPRGTSPVSVIVIKGGGEGEVEIELPGKYNVSGPVAGAMKTIAGVVDVELV
ncbi:MAG: DNA polymerase III subunit alpha [Ahrensia sp.]